jgi:di/tricarboxylate transporter
MTFEGRTDAGNFVTINGVAVNGIAPVTTTTANGLFRFNTVGLLWFQVRMSAFTSGACLITLTASGEPGMVTLSNLVAGSQSQALSQRASTYELNTYDTALATALGTAALFRLGFTVVEQVVAPTLNPTQPTVYAANEYANFPQYFPRLRVEIGGDKKLPLAQELGSNKLLVSTPEIISLLEQIKIQLQLANQLTMQINNLSIPNGWEEIK